MGTISREGPSKRLIGKHKYEGNPQRLYVWKFLKIILTIQIMTTNLETQWIVGFVDGEGCFNLDVHVKEDMRWGLQMQLEFTVVQHEYDRQVLEALKEVFGCGSVRVNRIDGTSTRLHYRCKNVKHLNNNIVPFFEKHKLKTKKRVEFERFRDIVHKMDAGYHNQSLKNFLEVIKLGEDLRVRFRPANKKKRTKVDEILNNLRLRSEADPTL
jgi:hypothetical protein